MNRENFQVAFRIIDTIEKAGFEAVIVGGAVRDFLLDREVNDVDVATNALPNEVKSIFSSTVDIGIEHGTVLVLDEGEPIEVTTYRTDGEYVDHRRPDNVQFVRSLEEDLQRRDFTINAMAMTENGDIIDLYGGQEDLQKKIIRAVGNPLNRFEEDALRMLRAVRFCAQLGFSIEDTTLQAIQNKSQQINFIARERIHMEFSKMWKASFVYQGIRMLVESNLAEHLMGSFKQTEADWKDFQTKQLEVGWAYLCLLNNWKVNEIASFYKLSNKEKNFIKQVQQAYLSLLKGWSEIDLFSNDLNVLETAYDFAVWQQQPLAFTKQTIVSRKLKLPIQSKEDLIINGNLLMEWSTRKRGPWIKEALDAALLAVLSGKIENNEKQLKEWFLYEFNDER